MVSTSGLVFRGHEHFRQRLLLATLSGKSIRIDDIRSDNEEHPGLMGAFSSKNFHLKCYEMSKHLFMNGSIDFEASFLRLLEKMTNGCHIEISYTGITILSSHSNSFIPSIIIKLIQSLKGTSVFYKPGLIVGGKISHDCPPSRAIGYFLEPLIALAPFAKFPSHITLTGITNDNVDVSV